MTLVSIMTQHETAQALMKLSTMIVLIAIGIAGIGVLTMPAWADESQDFVQSGRPAAA
jgi:hypothetical protein